MSLSLLDNISHYTHVIWDWNGTLLNDMELCIDVVGKMLEDQGLSRPTLNEYREKFGFPVVDYYRRLGFNFTAVPFEELATRYVKEYDRRAVTMPLFKGTRELLGAVAKQGIVQSLLSAAHQNHLDQLARHFGIEHFFAHIYGLSDHYAAGKIDRGRELMRDGKFDPNKTLLIGDTDHDAEVGRALGIRTLLIADGHQTYPRLRAVHDWVLESRYKI